MKYTLFLFILLAFTACKEEPVCELTDRSGIAYLNEKAGEPFTGKVECYHENGDLKSEGFYREGQRHGRFSYWRPDGIQEVAEHYVAGQLHGERLAWFPNGKPALKEFYKNGIPDREKHTWYESGQKAAEEYLKDGISDGKSLAWYENGNPKHEKHFADSKLDGACLTWYEDGTNATREFYVKGVCDGEQLAWHPNGKQQRQAFFQNGKRSSTWTEWDDSGNVVSQTTYYYGRTQKETEQAFIKTIREKQSRYVGQSCGTWAYECFTDQDYKRFNAQNMPAVVRSELLAEPAFASLALSIKRLPAGVWPQLRQRGLSTFKPTWAQLGRISCEGQTEAGQVAEKRVAQAVVRAAEEMSQKPEKALLETQPKT
ncbi:MAG: toxin-antitoxin system YwqK family antitoxin [Lewinellaceae bacterium]|nr:toxin-antitoxin system YwqK family antitoxin [Lewinellaceae bacterium]